MSEKETTLIPIDFASDTRILGEQTDKFLRLIYPGYLVNKNQLSDQMFEQNASLMLDGMTFFRITQCSVENVDDMFSGLNTQIEKLLTALHSINVAVGYGLISYGGMTNLVLCVYSGKNVPAVKNIVQGMLSGVDLREINPSFQQRLREERSYGMLSGVPTPFLKEQKQTFSLSSIMRSLNGTNYTMLFLAKPVSSGKIVETISELIHVRDSAFAISKRNISRSTSTTDSGTLTTNVTDTKSSNAGSVWAGGGTVIGAIAGSIIPGAGTIAGAAIGGGLGTIIGSVVGGESHSEGYSEAISRAVMSSEAISGDVQNGFAIELMNYADKAIERLKSGQNNGMWQTAITYSADSEMARNIIQACLCGELSKPDPDKLPLLTFAPEVNFFNNQELLIPKFLNSDIQNPLCSYINSSELGLLCTFPTESVPDFELRSAKRFPLFTSWKFEASAMVGHVADGKRIINNMPFSFNLDDLNKHTFVCGITGSGKTTTVKKILTEARKPFLVIESAKKEYRNIDLETKVYTLGKPEINCPRLNPFYIMPGVSPGAHIDYLKDLFNASFSFYGPMPYILEKCLHNVYKNKGWNLTLGFHPMLVNERSNVDFFDINYMHKQYAQQAHRFLFPTMQELKDEIERYIKEEMDYEGDVAGNIKTAIKIRLENLCIGAKGYMFNTYDQLDFEKLLQENAVFELEGLADDSDKAFCVGLMVIFINEYRQIIKESQGSSKLELQHLLVIEEAHRLLKNMDTERSSEHLGNPKGKAVEHFTNMIAEMRSYGQGVIVAEQIPSKLAPDVIKNTSNKIIQRIVAADDQQIIANTIGISPEDALQLGTLETGFALCHKEGMSLPVSVKVQSADDVYVSDETLYNMGMAERIRKINDSIARSILYEGDFAKRKALAFLNTLLAEEAQRVVEACEPVLLEFESLIKRKDALVLSKGYKNICAAILSEMVQGFLISGIYAVSSLPNDDTINLIENLVKSPSVNTASLLKNSLAKLYGRNPEMHARRIVSELIKRKSSPNIDLYATIEGYFINVSEQTKRNISSLVKGGK